MEETYILKIYRGHPENQYFEEFQLPLTPFSNVISGLMHIQKNPVNIYGEKVEPVVWEQGCLEEVCGSCSMLINGYPRQACTALILPIIEKSQNHVITLAPFTKFPLVRDLIVDRSIMFENLKKVHAWIDVDTSYDKGPGPKISPEQQEIMYTLSTCMTCGCCVEGCPQMNRHSKFLGPQIIAQVRLFNENPVGKLEELKRIKPLMGDGGVAECGNAQNCIRVCPKEIPLVDAIAVLGRKITVEMLKNLF